MRKRGRSRRALGVCRTPIVLSGLVVLALFLVFWLAPKPNPVGGATPYSPAYGDLVRSVASGGAGPMIAARLTGFSAGEPEPFGAALGFGAAATLEANLRIDRDLASEESPQHLAAWGVGQAVAGGCGRGIEALEEAYSRDPEDPRIRSDRVAAYLLCGADPEARPLDRITALDLAARERTHDGPEARYNLAAALDGVGLYRPAAEAWRQYLEVDDGDTVWSEHARRRARELDPSAGAADEAFRDALRLAAETGDATAVAAHVAGRPEQVAMEAERWLAEEAAAARIAGDAVSLRRSLDRVRLVADSLPVDFGGRFLADLEAELDGVGSASFRVARGLRDLAAAEVALDRFDLVGLERHLARAAARLAGGASLARARVFYLQGVAAYMEQDSVTAAALVERALAESRRAGDVKTLGSSLELLGVSASSANRFSTALSRMEAARDLYVRAGWSGRAAAANGAIAEVLDLVGDRRSAWRHRLAALAAIEEVRKVHVRLRLWSQAADGAADRYPDAAAFFAEEAFLVGTMSEAPVVREVALEEGARALELRGDLPGALRRLEEAERWAARAEPAALQAALRSKIRLAQARLLAAVDPPAAGEILDVAATLFAATGHEAAVPRLERERLRVARALNDEQGALTALSGALGAAEQSLAALHEPARRLLFASEWRGVYDEAIDLLIERGDEAGALALVERSRALRLPGQSSKTEEISRLAARLPPSTAVIVYRQLEERLLISVLLRSGTHMELVATARPATVRVLDRAEQALLADEVTAERHLERLHDLLLRPVAEALQGIDELVVVPDQPLQRVPFAALRNRDTGRYLAATVRVISSPSVRDAVAVALSSPEPLPPEAGLLAVAAPRPRFPRGLEPLTHATAEVESLRKRFSRVTALVEKGATPAAVLEALPRADVFHFAGHALGHDRAPLRSSLVLYEDGRGNHGLLTAERLVTLDLARLRLAVLPACGTGAAGAGAGDLAAALLAAGAKIVIATTREVDDQRSRAFVERFYDELGAGRDPAKAFHRAQRALLNSNAPELAHPATWGVFQLHRMAERGGAEQ